jgi:hypothetical protein
VDAIGYQGYIVAETFINPAGEVGRGMNIWRPLRASPPAAGQATREITLADLDTAAAQAAAFLRDRFGNA